jgi:AcrR family transcriptional regulator
VADDPPGTQRRLVEAARALIEAGGVESLSMRKVAADVGVTPTSIYWHIGSREALLHAVLDAMIDDLPRLRVRGTTPVARVTSLARSMREHFAATTRAQQLAQELGRGAELTFPAQVALAREMTAAGLRGPDAAQAVRAVLYLVGGFIMIEDNYRHRQPGARTTQELWRSVHDESVAAELRSAMARPADTGAVFDYAVERLVTSLLP